MTHQRLYTYDRRRRDQAGFTLMELVIGVGVLITALLGVLGVFLGLTVLNETSRNTTVATQHADRILEAIRNADYTTEVVVNAQAANDAAGWLPWAAAYPLDLTEASLTDVSVDIDPPFEGGESEVWSDATDPLRVQVRVLWTETGDRSRVTYVETQMTDR
jgi:type II secretory pathway pseudopilin PulG